MIEYLIEKKAKMDIMSNGESCFHGALARSPPSFEVVKYLCEKFDFLGQKKSKYLVQSPYILYHVERSFDFDIINYLLEKGEQVSSNNMIGKNILHMVCTREKLDIEFIKILVEKKVDVNCKGVFDKKTCFHHLSSNPGCTPEILTYLFQVAQPNLIFEKDKNQSCSFDVHCKGKSLRFDLLVVFLEIYIQKMFFKQIESCFIKCLKNEKVTLEIIEAFLDTKNTRLDIHEEILEDKNKFLHFYCHNTAYDEKILEFFLQYTNINHPTKYGSTPLTIACLSNNTQLVKSLVNKKADVNINKNTPIKNIKKDNIELMRFLVENNADPYKNDVFLECAKKNLVEVIATFLSHVKPPQDKVEQAYCFNSSKASGIVSKRYLDEGTAWFFDCHHLFPEVWKRKLKYFLILHNIKYPKRSIFRLPKPILLRIVKMSTFHDEI
jgi:ankyrin repeat protein